MRIITYSITHEKRARNCIFFIQFSCTKLKKQCCDICTVLLFLCCCVFSVAKFIRDERAGTLSFSLLIPRCSPASLMKLKKKGESEALISRLSAHRRHIDSLLFSSIVNLLWTWSVHASMHNICRQRSTLNGSSGILIGIAQTLHSFLCCSQICYSTFDAPYFG